MEKAKTRKIEITKITDKGLDITGRRAKETATQSTTCLLCCPSIPREDQTLHLNHRLIPMATTSSSSTQDNGTDKFHPVEGRIEKNGATAVSVKRISITFKVAKGWRGTKSRDFPGRTFIPQDGDILQQWARQFRRGDNLVQRTKDTRTVEAVVEARFRKPYSGPTEINRTHAFRWYRDTQDRLLNGSKKVQQANALKGIDDLDVCKMCTYISSAGNIVGFFCFGTVHT